MVVAAVAPVAQIRKWLRAQLAQMSKIPRTRWRQERALRLPVQAPQEGRLAITWVSVPRSGRPELTLASGSARFAAAGPSTLTLRARGAGLRQLRGRDRLRVDAYATFSRPVITILLPDSHPGSYTVSRRFTLR